MIARDCHSILPCNLAAEFSDVQCNVCTHVFRRYRERHTRVRAYVCRFVCTRIPERRYLAGMMVMVLPSPSLLLLMLLSLRPAVTSCSGSPFFSLSRPSSSRFIRRNGPRRSFLWRFRFIVTSIRAASDIALRLPFFIVIIEAREGVRV